MRGLGVVALALAVACTGSPRSTAPPVRPSAPPLPPAVTDLARWPVRGNVSAADRKTWRPAIGGPRGTFVYADRSTLAGTPTALLYVPRAGAPPLLALAREPLAYECVVECFVTSYVPAPGEAYVVSWLLPSRDGKARQLHLLTAPGVDSVRVAVDGAETPVQVTDGAGAATVAATGMVTLRWTARDGATGKSPVTFASPTCRWCHLA
jgi:hypothetical protein